MLGTDPNAKFKVTLKNYMHLDEKERPYFFLKYFTAREMRRQLDETRDRLIKLAQTSELPEKGVRFEYLKIGLVGWENVKDADGKPVPFDINEVDNYLTVAEIQELRDRWDEQGYGLEERKN